MMAECVGFVISRSQSSLISTLNCLKLHPKQRRLLAALSRSCAMPPNNPAKPNPDHVWLKNTFWWFWKWVTPFISQYVNFSFEIFKSRFFELVAHKLFISLFWYVNFRWLNPKVKWKRCWTKLIQNRRFPTCNFQMIKL